MTPWADCEGVRVQVLADRSKMDPTLKPYVIMNKAGDVWFEENLTFLPGWDWQGVPCGLQAGDRVKYGHRLGTVKSVQVQIRFDGRSVDDYAYLRDVQKVDHEPE